MSDKKSMDIIFGLENRVDAAIQAAPVLIKEQQATIDKLCEALLEAAGVIDDLNSHFESVHKLDAKISSEYRAIVKEVKGGG